MNKKPAGVTTHGMASHKHGRHPLYKVWATMKSRCSNKMHTSYKIYGDRGIKVCDEWKDDFMFFYTWALLNGYKKGLTIDRINNDGNYEPDNCRWATRKEQNRNTRRNILITYKGKTKILKDWAICLNIPYGRLLYRMTHGWSVEKAFTQKSRIKKNRMIPLEGCTVEFESEFIEVGGE